MLTRINANADQLETCDRSRRTFLNGVALLGITTFSSSLSSLQRTVESAKSTSESPKIFRVWAFADAHVGSDKRRGRESLAEALRQSESPAGFAWDIALDLGDMSGEQATPKDPEGEEIVRQFGVLQLHRREQIYDLSGNHDRSGPDEPQAWWWRKWWRKWIDPTGEHTEFSQVDATRRPFPIEGTWERYGFRARNILFLMMSDINEPTQKVGRGTLGGNPGGVVSSETFRWWKGMVEQNRVDHHQRTPLRAEEHHGRVRRMGRHAARRKRRVEILVSRLLSSGHAAGRIVFVLGR